MTLQDSKSTTTHLHRILLVEDDQQISSMLSDFLNDNGFAVSVTQNAPDMDAEMKRTDFDLVVLDAMLPGEDGFSICRRLRAASTIPIIMLTALAEDVNRIIGIELGADDYLAKPFNPRELMARIRGLLRRASYGSEAPDVMKPLLFSGWRLDPKSRQLQDSNGVYVSMTTAEFDVLLAFCRNSGKIMSRDDLLSLTHAGSAGPVERSIDVHISRVRQKIEPNVKEPTMIKTVRLAGYVFTPSVEIEHP